MLTLNCVIGGSPLRGAEAYLRHFNSYTTQLRKRRMQQTPQNLIDAGYSVVPIAQNEKRPYSKDWNNTLFTAKAFKPNDGIGIKTNDLVAIDLDVYNVDIAEKLRNYVSAIIEVPCYRVGMPPKLLIPALCPEIKKKITSKKYHEHADTTKPPIHQIEILSGGQQFVTCGTHPDTQKPYKWYGELPPIYQLPKITIKQIEMLFTRFDELATNEKWFTAPVVKGRKFPDPSDAQKVFNTETQIEDVLRKFGWKQHGDTKGWIRAGKDRGFGGTTYEDSNTFYCFTSSTILEEGFTYRPFDLLAAYKYKGDRKAAEEAIKPAVVEFKKKRQTDFDTNFCFNKSDNKYYNINSPACKGVIDVAMMRAYKTPDTQLRNPKNVVVGKGYFPNKPSIYYDKDVRDKLLNVFRFPEFQTGSVKLIEPWLGLTNFLWTEQTEFVLDCLASIIQEPEKRLPLMFFLLAKPGAGKDIWLRLFCAAIGTWNCTKSNLEDVAGLGKEWGDWAYQSLVTTISEAYVSGKGRIALGERLRDKIDSPRLPLNLKYAGSGTFYVFTTIFAFTNNPESISIPLNDRRILACSSDFLMPEGEDKEKFFSKMVAGMENPKVTGALFQYLKNRKITHNVYGKAPETDYKNALMMSGSDIIEEALIHLKMNNELDIMLNCDIRDFVEDYIAPEPFDTAYANARYRSALGNQFAKINKGKVMEYKGLKPNKLYALRDHSKWMSAENHQIRAYLENHLVKGSDERKRSY